MSAPEAYHKTQHAVSTRLFQAASLIAAGFAGIGVAIGVHDATLHSSWFIPIASGMAVALLFGTAWHVLLGFGARSRRREAVLAIAAAGVVVSCLTLGASAQAIANAMAGNSALQSVLADKVDGYAATLDDAHKQATGFRSLTELARVNSAAYGAMAEQEAAGDLGGGARCGSRCIEMQSFADNFGRSADALDTLLMEADNLRDNGTDIVATMRAAAAAADQDAFMASTAALGQVVSALNGIDPSPIVSTTGVVVVDTSQDVSLDSQTAAFHLEADRVLAERLPVAVPAFAPVSKFEATRSEAFGAALHGWLAASAIDLIPLLFLFIVMLTAADPLLRDLPYVAPKRKSDLDRNAAIRSEELDTSIGRGPRLVAGE